MFEKLKLRWNIQTNFQVIMFKNRSKIMFILVLAGFHFNSNKIMARDLEKITLGGGCFWCTEAVYLELNGVVAVLPGYSGGSVISPTYNEVVAGNTGHAEVVQVTFDPMVVTFKEILEVFFATHDPTTLNRQGADIGTQYRSAVFFHSKEQKEIANQIITLLNKQKVFENPVVTEVSMFDKFYVAEDYHVNYYKKNKNQPYCQFVVSPKLDKFEKVFKDKLKK